MRNLGDFSTGSNGKAITPVRLGRGLPAGKESGAGELVIVRGCHATRAAYPTSGQTCIAAKAEAIER